MEIQIELFQEKHKLELTKLFEKVILHTLELQGFTMKSHPDIVQAKIKKQHKTMEKYLKSGGKDEHILLAQKDGEIVGVMAHGQPSQDIIQNIELADGTREIKSAYILPDHQHQGIGTTLLEAILNDLEKMGIEYFTLYTSYDTGKNFRSKKFGEPEKIIEHYFTDNLNCYIWYKKLSDFI